MSVLLKAGNKVSFISEQLNIHHSTVYRELNINSRPRGNYNSNYANQYAQIGIERYAKTRKLNSEMISSIKNKLETAQLSPE
ncbi:MAG: hypothetical protein GY936_20700 [Ignavibacteriae bacterium]|nr:hypothetical protein [Ignavibacteriota bacterium]